MFYLTKLIERIYVYYTNIFLERYHKIHGYNIFWMAENCLNFNALRNKVVHQLNARDSILDTILRILQLILAIQSIEKVLKSQNILDKDTRHLKFYNRIIGSLIKSICLETWNKINDCYLDTIEAFPDELQRWEERNLKYVAYLVLAWDLAGFFVYFSKKLISNAIATRRVSS